MTTATGSGWRFSALSGLFDQQTAEELQSVVVQGFAVDISIVEMYSRPTDFLSVFEERLCDCGATDQTAHVAAMLASLSIRAQLDKPAAQVMATYKKYGIDDPHPLKCPVCGSAPSLAAVGGGDSTQNHGKTLGCLQCGAEWSFERIRCVRCGTKNQSHIHFTSIEDDDAHRIGTCDECGGYIRTYYASDALVPCSFEVEDVVMAKLDAIALQMLRQ